MRKRYFCDGWARRDFLQVGAAGAMGLNLSLAQLLQAFHNGSPFVCRCFRLELLNRTHYSAGAAAARQLAGARAVVNINTSSRGGLDSLDHANLDPPVDEEGAERIRRSAAPLTKFLRGRWQSEWKRAGLRHTSVSLQFAILMQAGVDTSAPPAAIN